MNISSSKENILKKIRQALSNPVPVPFPKSEGNNSVYQPPSEDIEIQFAEEFTKLLGKFAFCINEADLINQLKKLIAERKWENIYCNEENLFEIVSKSSAFKTYPSVSTDKKNFAGKL